MQPLKSGQICFSPCCIKCNPNWITKYKAAHKPCHPLPCHFLYATSPSLLAKAWLTISSFWLQIHACAMDMISGLAEGLGPSMDPLIQGSQLVPVGAHILSLSPVPLLSLWVCLLLSFLLDPDFACSVLFCCVDAPVSMQCSMHTPSLLLVTCVP